MLPISMPSQQCGMKRLRAKSLPQKQLTHRLAAVEEGKKTAHRLKEQIMIHDDDELCSLSDFNMIHAIFYGKRTISETS